MHRYLTISHNFFLTKFLIIFLQNYFFIIITKLILSLKNYLYLIAQLNNKLYFTFIQLLYTIKLLLILCMLDNMLSEFL